MKSFISALLICALVLTIAGCSTVTEYDNYSDLIHSDTDVSDADAAEDSSSLVSFQEKLRAEGKVIGVAYLGRFEGDFETARSELLGKDYLRDISFVKYIDKFAENDGDSMYCIVPADETVYITVSKCENYDFKTYYGEELISANEPILLRGNSSDANSNLYVEAGNDSIKVNFFPYQSPYDGRLFNSDSMIYDFSPYEYMPEFADASETPCGPWILYANDGNGERRVMILTITSDGKAYYRYGYSESEMIETFEGTWKTDGNILELNMVGGPANSEGILHDFNAAFEWHINEYDLVLKHIDGDPLLYGTEGQTFEFLAFYQ